jgi:hypothetical protein
VSARVPANDGTPGNDANTPPVPDEVWHRFLTGSEHSIRVSAPRELSAFERAAAPRTALPPSPPEERRHAHRRPEAPAWREGFLFETGAVGELWQPSCPHPRSPWRELDGMAKCRRLGRVLCTAAAITLVLGLFSQVQTSSSPYDGQDDAVSQQSEKAPPEWPAATPGVTASPSG